MGNTVGTGLPSPELVYGFTDQFLAKGFDSRSPTPHFHKELWNLLCGPETFVAVAAPRGHAKSTACTLSFLLTCMLFRYKEFALIISDTANQAYEFLGNIRRELEYNEELVQLFGIKGFDPDNRDTMVCKMVGDDGKPHEFRISAKGSMQSMRGALWRGREESKRPDLIICDDLENDELVENEDRRHKLRSWFFNTLIPAGTPDTRLRIVGTVLHFDSLLERFMPERANEDTPDNLVITPLKTYSKDHKKSGRKTWKSVKYRAHSEDYQEYLWPQRFTEEYLEQIRSGYMEDGNPEGYAREYLNNPIASENQIFRTEDLIPFNKETQGPWETILVGDLAISDKDKRAYTCIACLATNPDGIVRVFDVKRFRGDTYEIVEEIFNLSEIYGADTILLENENIAKTLGPVLEREIQLRDAWLLVEPVPCNRDKRARARPLQLRTRQHKVEFDHSAPWWPALSVEMLQFPDGPYKDQVDAIAHYFLWINNVNHAKSTRDLEMEEYERHMEDFYEETGADGRSPLTGY